MINGFMTCIICMMPKQNSGYTTHVGMLLKTPFRPSTFFVVDSPLVFAYVIRFSSYSAILQTAILRVCSFLIQRIFSNATKQKSPHTKSVCVVGAPIYLRVPLVLLYNYANKNYDFFIFIFTFQQRKFTCFAPRFKILDPPLVRKLFFIFIR